ncbi:hypothetical protein NMY22_g15476 [Coprinellus aureogranulatus]|nr:hypothetical protein NMY22_g15476 [Coprinellus aureogranulatus]
MTRFPNVTQVTINFQGFYSSYAQGPSGNGPPSNFPNIDTLRLHGLYWQQHDNTQILRCLALPLLAKLELGFEDDDCSELEDEDLLHIAADISQLARHSNGLPDLRVVKLRDIIITGHGLCNIFRQIPSTIHLVLDRITIKDYSILFSSDILPKLEILELLNFEDDGPSVAALREALGFVQNRSPNRPVETGATGIALRIKKLAVSIKNMRSYWDLHHRWATVMEQQGTEYSYAKEESC